MCASFTELFEQDDWYREELEGVKPLESGKRKAGELVFREKIRREVRRGGRMMLTADIIDQRFPSGRLTIVATRLEKLSAALCVKLV